MPNAVIDYGNLADRYSVDPQSCLKTRFLPSICFYDPSYGENLCHECCHVLKHVVINLMLSYLIFSLLPVSRISPTKRSTGTSGASSAAFAATLWSTSRLAAKRKRSTAEIATPTNLPQDAMDAAKSSNQVSAM